MARTPTRPPAVRAALRAAASTAVLAVGATLLTACSSTNSVNAAQGGPSASASAAGRNQQMAAYRQCLSEHGVNLPARPSGRPSGAAGGGGFGSGGASADPTRQKALQACAALRPQFNGRGGRGGFDGTAMKAFTSCAARRPPPAACTAEAGSPPCGEGHACWTTLRHLISGSLQVPLRVGDMCAQETSRSGVAQADARTGRNECLV